MAFLLECALLGFSFSLIFVAEARTCEYNEYIIESKSGNLTCLTCRSCPAGFGLFPPCGTRIKFNEMKNECKPCVLGKTYSAHEDISSCNPCGSCADHQTILKNCTLVSDSQCDDMCSKGFYFEDLTGDCQPCSWCCSDGSNKVRSGCKEMPFYKQCDVNTAKNCKPKCQSDQYVVPGSKGGGHCENCDVCPPGTSPFPVCGSVVENINIIGCRVCIKGQTFSDNYGKSPCKPCTRCAIGQKEVLPCNWENDRMCSYCDKGFYSDNNSSKCKRCSVCCNNDEDVRVEQCAKQRMPKKSQCSYVKGRGSVCGHRRIEDRKSISPVWLGVIVAVGIIVVVATIILVVLCWYRRFCRQVTIVVEESSSLLTSPEQKDETSQQETVKFFDNSGVIVHFNDHESLRLEVQEVRSEICWDEALCINLLNDDEVQLSPVVEFQPRGSRMSNPVRVRIPHSALVDSSHGWSIGLKSLVLSEGSIVWKDETVDGTQYNEVSFCTNCLLSYVVVGTPAGNSDPTKKRFYCVVFGGQGKVGSNYSVFLYVIDECEASLEKIIQDEKSRKRILLSSLHSLHVESVHETDLKVAVKQLSSSWKIASDNPCVITHKSLRQSYQTFPCAEIIFAHDNGQNGQFRCTFELTAGDATSQICVRTSIEEEPFGNYKDSGMCRRHQMVTGHSAHASKPLLSLVNDYSTLVEDIYEHLDTPIPGAGHYEGIAKYFGYKYFTIKSKFERSHGSPSRALIEALTAWQPTLTVESFAVVVEDQAGRNDVAFLLRKYDRNSLEESV